MVVAPLQLVLREPGQQRPGTGQAPRGRLRVSLPEFKALYPDVELELDFNDRLV
ncbi:hypothetical protein AVHM3334_05830 [Acidovorax sp. SUPP3334]|nr:hypothetical protein AVHM3334_05830 [Acidovorax sp. SUPP3334]